MTATKEKATKHTVDLGADPYTSDGYTVEEHHGEGIGRIENRNDELYINNQKIVLRLSERQIDGKTIKGHELREELTNERVLNANVLDYLLEHPELIPKSWKGKSIFFWGTIYCEDSDVYLFVRFLYCAVGRWYWNWCLLDWDWHSDLPAAVLEEAA